MICVYIFSNEDTPLSIKQYLLDTAAYEATEDNKNPSISPNNVDDEQNDV